MTKTTRETEAEYNNFIIFGICIVIIVSFIVYDSVAIEPIRQEISNMPHYECRNETYGHPEMINCTGYNTESYSLIKCIYPKVEVKEVCEIK